jgi:hypothetical protein
LRQKLLETNAPMPSGPPQRRAAVSAEQVVLKNTLAAVDALADRGTTQEHGRRGQHDAQVHAFVGDFVLLQRGLCSSSSCWHFIIA